MTAAIEISGLVKTYGRHRALDGLDLRVEQGSVFGFLGANGSGKTTALRIILALARQTAGSVRILGHEPGSAGVRPLIGYCPDVPGFLPWMTARDVLESSAILFRLPEPLARQRVGDLLDLTGLADTRAHVGGYSRGMRQRLGLAQALINSPRLLLLDEPTSALDPMGRRVVLELISELRGKTTVFFSTHLLPDVERVCDSAAIIDAGRIVTSGPLEQIRAKNSATRSRLLVEVDSPVKLQQALVEQPWVSSVTDAEAPGALVVAVTDLDEAAARFPAQIADLGLRLRRLEPQEASLEDVFVGMVGARS